MHSHDWTPDFIKNNLPLVLDANAVINLRSYPPPYGYATPQAPYDSDPEKGKTHCPEQTNYIGYSYGSLLAAQTAMYYANRGYIIDNLVLIGSPIDSDFLNTLRTNKNIKKVIVKDLTFAGDKIYAGMSEPALLAAVPAIALDFPKEGAGHFYYSSSNDVGKQRRLDFAKEMYKLGLR